jgi:diguanylate cyclase (GGDEF)-like protein
MSQTVLIADDALPLHALVKAHLEPDGLAVHSVYDGEAAVAIATTLRPDLLLLDVDMPRIDGFEACRRIKANPITAGIPTLFLTADAMMMDKVKGLELGAVDYIVKPFKPEELRARVRAALRALAAIEQVRMVDGLTGLWNKSYFDLQLRAQLSLAHRSSKPMACVVCDVDHLSTVNVKFGDSAGNNILRSIGRILLGRSRAEDIVCRIGGGKFAILSIGINRSSAAQMAERLRGEVERQCATRSGVDMPVTASFGVADTLVATGIEIFARADNALERAKRVGRNSVSIARDSSTTTTAAA